LTVARLFNSGIATRCFNMLLKNYYFRFNLAGTLLAIIGITLFSALGIWQSNRAIEKQQLQEDFDRKNTQAAFLLNTSVDRLEAKKFLKTEVVGHYDSASEKLIDNTVHKGNAGYYVMTPFVLKDHNSDRPLIIMVNRGWVPVGRDRNELPKLEAPAGEVRIKGQLAPPKSKPPLILGELPVREKVWPYFDLTVFRQNASAEVLPLIILLGQDEEGGYVREWPKYESKIGMHIGYAIQWFVFALIVLVTYLGMNIKKREMNEHADDN